MIFRPIDLCLCGGGMGGNARRAVRGVGTIMMMYLHGGDWQQIRAALRTIGAPTTAAELGIPDQYVIDALVHASEIRPERYTILGTGLTVDAAVNVARITGVVCQ